jgi:hypothetical protein
MKPGDEWVYKRRFKGEGVGSSHTFSPAAVGLQQKMQKDGFMFVAWVGLKYKTVFGYGWRVGVWGDQNCHPSSDICLRWEQVVVLVLHRIIILKW